ncbi:hypothetical protein QFZ55_003055 [Streptomyces luteogriseus]|uniref:hypothetical protein n=1 Tax=Streptomyces luteogriseus TaxID=68233 RepID=UPI002783FFCC|nr:hypothetical protein [Streptomyces luteogriseus]MDQ0713603.1 hypothetical protein [Streptomyces luteogriseus]
MATVTAALRHTRPHPTHRRLEADTPPEAADEHSPDGWEANHAVLAHLAEHRVAWRP